MAMSEGYICYNEMNKYITIIVYTIFISFAHAAFRAPNAVVPKMPGIKPKLAPDNAKVVAMRDKKLDMLAKLGDIKFNKKGGLINGVKYFAGKQELKRLENKLAKTSSGSEMINTHLMIERMKNRESIYMNDNIKGQMSTQSLNNAGRYYSHFLGKHPPASTGLRA
ncbi:hypothetical protein ROZALSC1DRAFT_27610 [Rozella allomycis CSF55]|uniref:Uncharacterized protein n=1 Tax=Rozella allomycis (strain CSF55) TaxID=988480 RepID=A0A075B535_ROZAC|nr:hypothetical protein O9G_006065 [Rozella allomycis CSF55]RKP20937.1 hypothetical protein ROZALSC1DRAFT_27610 [Rozella allomycis CSF55]|eukprot:EPZ36703.1 hypothetical protein O9G_006065 [Rozella allomycis CSF55]